MSFHTRLIAANTTTGAKPWDRVVEVVEAHGDLDLACLVSACLECGSIAAAPDRESRDNIVEHYDTTCCNRATTATFRTLPATPEPTPGPLDHLDKATAFGAICDWLAKNATTYKAVSGESFQIEFPETDEVYDVLVQNMADFL